MGAAPAARQRGGMPTTGADPPGHVLDPQAASMHHDRMYRAALRLTRSAHDAEDLTQETFANVLARPRAVRNGDDVAYLLQAVRNTHTSASREAGRRPCTSVAPESLERLPACRDDPHAAAEARDVIASIALLRAGQRDVVLAVDLLGLSYAEAAAALCVPPGTVMSRLHRARAALAG